MKTFFGTPGDPPVVTVGKRALVGTFGWGKSVHSGALAKAILVEHLGDEPAATKYHRRFMWRTVATWDAGKPWTLTTAEIDAALADIREVEKDKMTVAQRAQIANERAPVADEAGLGLSEVRIKG